MRINLATALLVITATIALLLLVPLSVVSADFMQSVSLDISQSKARPAIRTNARVQVQGADSTRSVSLDISQLQARLPELEPTQEPTHTPVPANEPSDNSAWIGFLGIIIGAIITSIIGPIIRDRFRRQGTTT